MLQANCSFYLGNSYNFVNGTSSGSQFYVAGASSNSNGNGTVSPTPIFNTPQRADPLSGLPAPSAGSCTYTKKSVNNASANLSPGTYCGGLTINNASAVNLQAGTYIIQGALNITNSNVYGSGITFYLSQGNGYAYAPSNISNFAGTLSAPTSGSLQGILIFADRSLPAGHATLTFMDFNSSTRMDGIVYLPGQQLNSSNSTLQGSHYFGLVADYTTMNNTSFTPSTDYSTLAGGSPFPSSSAGLVE